LATPLRLHWKQTTDGGKNALRRQVWQLSAPALTEMVMVSLVTVINMMMVGRLGAEQITAVGLPQQPFWLAMSFVVSLNVGTTAIVARAIGANQDKVADRAFSQAIVLSGIIGVVIGASFIWLAEPVVRFMGGQGSVVQLSVDYLRIIALSIPLFTLSSTVLAALRGAGETRTAMMVNAISNIVVIVLGIPLVYGWGPLPRLEVAGAGWALVFARVYMLIACGVVVLGKKRRLRLILRQSRLFKDRLLADILRIGVPSAMEQFLLQLGLMMFLRTVASMGTETYAAHQVVSNITSLSWQPGMGFAVAAATLAGQYLGAGQPQKAEDAVRQAQQYGLRFAWVMLFVFLIAGRFIVGLYTMDQEVIRLAVPALYVVAFVQPSQSTQIIQAGGLRGAGATMEPLISTAVGIWLVRSIVIAITLGWFHMGLVGAWTAIAVDQFSRYFFISYLFRKGRWKHVKIGVATD
jgi:putative MATE family efflux protein